MSSVDSPEFAAGMVKRGVTEIWCRRVLWLASAIAGVALLSHFSLMLWAQHEFGPPESVVAAQSTMLTHDGTLYYSLRDYPYTISAYTPIFYVLEAALIEAGFPAYTAGRLISFAALLGIFVLVWRFAILYTRNRYCAWTGVVLCSSTSLLLGWGAIGQVDTLAVYLAMLGFYQYSRFALRGESTLFSAALCVIAAFFTKQTMIACPAAIVLSLWIRNRRVALQFAAGVGGAILTAVFLINAVLGGRFLEDTVFANLNPWAWGKLGQQVHYLLIASGQLILVVTIGVRTAIRSQAKALFLYLGLAACVLGITAPKIGSDLNYQIEATVLLILCTCVALDATDFFPLVFRRSKDWITLLQIPLAIHLAVNFRIVEPLLLARFVNERLFREQVAAERSYLADGGRVLSADLDGTVHLRGRLEVEPLIYTLLIRAGRIDPEPVRRDIAAKIFSTIVLYEDVNHPFYSNLELLAFSGPQLDEIRKHYRMVARIPGPYLAGVFVYKPVLGDVQ